MNEPVSPYEASPPAASRLIATVAAALAAAAIILVLFVLPAEYGIDPTGVGRITGLTQISSPTKTMEVRDVIGGNEKIHEVKVPDTGDPIPLPNPAVIQ